MEAFDGKWFDRIKKNNSQARRRLSFERLSEIKKQFFAGDIEYENLTYPQILDQNYSRKIAALEELSSDINNCRDTNPIVAILYQEKIKEKILRLELIKIAALLQENTNDNQKLVAEFKSVTETLFGAPNQDIFNHLASVIKHELAASPESFKATASYQELVKIFDAERNTDVEKFEKIKGLDSSEPAFKDAAVVSKIIKKELDEIGLKEWQVNICQNSSSRFYVSAEEKTVFVPRDSILKNRTNDRSLTKDTLMGLIEHEVKTHALRADNGYKSQLKLLAIGLPNYLRGEEGIATYREQQITGAEDYASAHIYLAISLAYGLDRSNEPRDFREVFEIMKSYYEMKYYDLKEDTASKAFNTCRQIFISTARECPSLVLTQGLVYREGNIAIHELLKEKPKVESDFNIGKYDPTNLQHVSCLRELGLIGS